MKILYTEYAGLGIPIDLDVALQTLKTGNAGAPLRLEHLSNKLLPLLIFGGPNKAFTCLLFVHWRKWQRKDSYAAKDSNIEAGPKFTIAICCKMVTCCRN